MKRLFFLFLASLIFFSACNAPAAEPPAPTSLPTSAAAATKAPPTPTPEPTPTPGPVAVPLVFEGWQNKAFAYACVDVIYVMSEDEIAGKVIPAASSLLEALGIKVVPMADAQCEAKLIFTLSLMGKGKVEYLENGENCARFTKAEFVGDLNFMAPPGGDSFWVPVYNIYEAPPQDPKKCEMDLQALLDILWPKAVINSLKEVYGDKVVEAAMSVPELQAAALEIKNQK
jgi:hypothetical protein